jgi:MerR family transcriptional regulator, light-induced transcriptional regulator
MNLQEAADRIGVHYQTAYRWVREGILNATKVGATYELDGADVDAFLAARRTPSQPPQRVQVRDWSAQRDRFYAAIATGDELDARDQISRLTEGNIGVLELCEELIVPCMRRIGDEWHAGLVSIGQEHRATAITERMLARLSVHPRGRPRGTAIVTAPPGETHGLPGLLAALVLREAHWRVHHLGADLPASEIDAMVTAVRADLVVISSTVAMASGADSSGRSSNAADPDAQAGGTPPPDPLAALAETLKGQGVRVLIGRAGDSLRSLLAQANGEAPG